MNTQNMNAVQQSVNSAPGSGRFAGPGLRLASAALAVTGRVGDLASLYNPFAHGWDLHWRATPGAEFYEVQTNPNPAVATQWAAAGNAEGTRTVLLATAPAQRPWVRVRAVGAAGPGAWSDPIQVSARVAHWRSAA